MGMIKPEKGEKHRFVLELPGTKDLTQPNYEAYKTAIEKAVKKFGAKIVKGEHIITKKKKGPK